MGIARNERVSRRWFYRPFFGHWLNAVHVFCGSPPISTLFAARWYESRCVFLVSCELMRQGSISFDAWFLNLQRHGCRWSLQVLMLWCRPAFLIAFVSGIHHHLWRSQAITPIISKFYCPTIFRWPYGLCGIVTTSDGEVPPLLVTGFIPVDCEFIS